MPVKVDSEIRIFSEHEFHAIAARVIGISFDVHNEFGRLMDEEVYKRTICRRCEAVGITPAQREVEIKVSFQDFEKRYFMDMLFACGLMVEAKAVEKLTKAHQAQTLHYLLLSEMKHGLLLNFRSDKVEKRFVSTTLDLEKRQSYTVLDAAWSPLNQASRILHQTFLSLLDDWGAFLQTSLYRDAIVHVFGGPEVALQKIQILDGNTEVGTHELLLVDDDTAVALTS